MKASITSTVFLALAINFFVPVAPTNQKPDTSGAEILKRGVSQSAIRNEKRFAKLVVSSFREAKAPGGIVYSGGLDENTPISIQQKTHSFHEVLDALVDVHPGYKWELLDGVVNISPRESEPPILNTFVPEFHQEKATVAEMVEELELSLEVQGQAAALGFSRHGQQYDGPISFDAYKLSCKNFTVREILNEIVRVSGKAIWYYREETIQGKKYFWLGVHYS